MQHPIDPIDNAFESLKGRAMPGDAYNPQLKERLMREFNTNRSEKHPRRRMILAAALAFVLLGGAGFAAAGGVDMVKSWFITIEVDGEPIAVEEFEGNITIEEDGEITTVTVDLPEGAVDLPEGVVEGQTVTVHLSDVPQTEAKSSEKDE